MSSFEVATTTYIPDARDSNNEKTEYELLPEGKHKATIESVTRKREDMLINARNKENVKHVADLLEVVYNIHPENDAIDSKGKAFTNRKIWSSAIWIWKDKDHIKTLGHDTLMVQANEGGNERYSKFLDVAGYKLEEKIVEMEDAKGEMVKRKAVTLPIDIDLDLAINKSVIINVKNRTYTDKSGNEKTAQNELGLYPWDNGDDDDLPF